MISTTIQVYGYHAIITDILFPVTETEIRFPDNIQLALCNFVQKNIIVQIPVMKAPGI